MKKIHSKIIGILAAIILIAQTVLLLVPNSALAASCTFTFSGANVKVGETFSITLTWSTSDSDLGAFDGTVEFDSSMLELVSGHQYPAEVLASEDQKSASYSYTFKALKEGTTTVRLNPGYVCSFTTAEAMNVSSNAGTITITSPTEAPTTAAPTTAAPTTAAPTTAAPTQPTTTQPATEPTTEATTAESTTEEDTTEALSDNAYLEALSVYPGTLSPAFTPEKRIYDVTVGYETTKLSVSVVTADVDATYIITDTNLKVGLNYIDIKVTAADGTVRWYGLHVVREEEDTTAESTTEEVTTAEPTTEQTTEGTETVDPLAVIVGSSEGRVQETLGNITKPEGFEETTYEFRGVEIEALQGLGNKLVLVSVAVDGEIKLYIYNQSVDGLYPYVGIQITSALYTVLPFDADEKLPNGYKLTVIDFEGSLIDAWVRTDAEDNNYVLFYAMNWEGATALYRYDAEENTLQRVNKSEIAVVEIPEESTQETEASSESSSQNSAEVNSQYLNYYEEQLEKINRRDTIMFVIMIILLICLIGMYLLFSSGKKGEEPEDLDDDPDDDPDDDTETDDDELDDDFDDEEIANELTEEAAASDTAVEAAEPDVGEDEADAFQKELEQIQLGMAGIVAGFVEEDSEEEQAEEEQALEDETASEDELALDGELVLDDETVSGDEVDSDEDVVSGDEVISDDEFEDFDGLEAFADEEVVKDVTDESIDSGLNEDEQFENLAEDLSGDLGTEELELEELDLDELDFEDIEL